jgi:dihydrofolate reductase
MSSLILSLTTTADGVITVGEWFVGEGEHDRASREQFDGAAGMVLGRTTFEGLAAYWSPLTARGPT